ncbi:hypothetical protein [Oceanobacillus halophilus]|uniref:Lipoprotein n=1 Tax=Oceanobacillus halophilus TaxID=930130 RepID=A0A494ZSJ7_9BACI|nr:hypothetical protein [Oceanobacillus halophilus]RKQ28336.1 hypothetical protein D8M06_18995 [Oceanobacillus halophilus]
MKKLIFSLNLSFIMVLTLTACADSSSSISPADEFKEYKTEGIEPIYERSQELSEMSGHFTTIVDQPEKAYNYLNDNIIPFVEDTKELAQDLNSNLVNQEIKDLNEISLKQLDLLIDSFSKQAEVVKLNTPPVDDESYNQSEEIYMEVIDLQEEIDQVIEAYNAKIDELEEKYGV